ncbi:MAG TPA: ACP S-malonyltransferase [Armatimonadota bacterium]|jgi:[acyl-carrier-protein] S-malonyltransferase
MLMAVWAFVFPGQGAQTVGMGKALAEAHPEAMAVWDEAERSLGIPLKEIAWSGPAETLTRTDIAQPALLTASIATLRVLERLGWSPNATAGHSLGEYSALVAAAALRFSDAVKVVRTRGEAMQKAAEASGGGMAAVLGASNEALAALCREIGDIVPANINAPGQVVVSGSEAGLAALDARRKEIGARRVARLTVAGPFHSPAMAPAADAVRDALNIIAIQDPVCSVYANVTARQEWTSAEVRANLIAQVTGQVRWEETVLNMCADGHNHFVEVGPGSVLAGLIRRISADAVVHSVGDPESLEAFRAAAQ